MIIASVLHQRIAVGNDPANIIVAIVERNLLIL